MNEQQNTSLRNAAVRLAATYGPANDLLVDLASVKLLSSTVIRFDAFRADDSPVSVYVDVTFAPDGLSAVVRTPYHNSSERADLRPFAEQVREAILARPESQKDAACAAVLANWDTTHLGECPECPECFSKVPRLTAAGCCSFCE